MKTLAAVLAAAALAGCVPYNTNRVATVPHASAPMRTGAPLDARVALTGGASNLADAVDPSLGDASAGIEVPSTQLRGDLRARATDHLEVGLVHEQGVAATAHALDDTQPPVDAGNPVGYGLIATYAVPTGDPAWHVGLTAEALVWSVPWVEYASCADCETPITTMSRGRDTVSTLGLGGNVNFKAGRVTYFGGLFARNQPTNTQKGQTTAPGLGGVEDGPMNLLVNAGVEVALGSGVSGLILAHQTLSRDPVVYGPGLGLALTIPLLR